MFWRTGEFPVSARKSKQTSLIINSKALSLYRQSYNCSLVRILRIRIYGYEYWFSDFEVTDVLWIVIVTLFCGGCCDGTGGGSSSSSSSSSSSGGSEIATAVVCFVGRTY